jgi:hypothetical protein
MDPEITDTVTGWESVVAGSGYAGLRSLADDEFSGAVTAGLAWAFFLNGRVIGVFDGEIEDFSGADLTAYRAPDPALALLFAMRETGGETRGQYYTEKTPLTEVDSTLSGGGFTGYVELSENVLSGDYYVVYHAGESMSVAFVGASGRLVTDDEAFDLAADEVGIYDVNAVDVSVVDIPGTPSTGETTDDSGTEQSEEEEDGTDWRGEGTTDDASDVDDTDHAPSEGATGLTGVTFEDRSSAVETDATTADADESTDRTDGRDAGERSSPEAEPSTEIETDGETDDEAAPWEEEIDDTDGVTDTEGVDGLNDEIAESNDGIDDRSDEEGVSGDGVGAGDERGAVGGTEGDDAGGVGTKTRDGADRRAGADEVSDGVGAGAAGDDASTDDTSTTAADGENQFSAERQWQQTRRIPALDPEESMDPADGAVGVEDGTEPAGTDPVAHDEGSTDDVEGSAGRNTEGAASEPDAGPAPAASSADTDAEATPDAIEEELQRAEEALAATEAERDELAARVEELEARLETVSRERDEHRQRVAQLESEVEQLRESVDRTDAGGGGGDSLSPTAARDGTNLFVRYRSKGKPTLDDAREGEATQDDVVDNLRIEYLTAFDDETATVDGEPYETFLYATTEWQFVTWVVEELLYEIGRSGHRGDMAALFDRIPEIDRVQFNGEVPVTVEDETGTSHESRTFDLVFWDSMGDPLFVVNLDAGRMATTEGMVDSFIEGARAVGASKETLGGAFFVTTSYFEPGALDAVGEATSGGLLSRSSKTSFVKLSRKQGYHLCLVEARDGEFHLTVPEL